MKILVVGDDSFVREMAMARSRDADVGVIAAARGGKALKLLQNGSDKTPVAVRGASP
jgi:DNA-binding response OmpR family regulator